LGKQKKDERLKLTIQFLSWEYSELDLYSLARLEILIELNLLDRSLCASKCLLQTRLLVLTSDLFRI